MAPEIPRDVWMLVLQQLPRDSWFSLLTVNSVLYDIAMDERYREVRLTGSLDHREVIKALLRLREPEVSRRVRRLHIQHWFIQHFFDSEGRPLPSWPQPRRTQWNFKPKTLAESLGRSSQPSRSNSSPVPDFKTMTDLSRAVVEAVASLSNVTHYDVEWTALPFDYPFLPLFSAAWTAFGSNLRSLTINARLDKLHALISETHSVTFDSLLELHLRFLPENRPQDDATFVGRLENSVAPFINTLCDTLEYLSIWSYGYLDLSLFFSKLVCYPHLKRIGFRIPFDAFHLSHPSGFSRVLSAHSKTLRHVTLKHRSPLEIPNANSLKERFNFGQATLNVDLQNLETLEIGLDKVWLGLEDSIMHIIRTSAHRLTTFALHDHFLTFEEADALLVVLSQRSPSTGLKSLRLSLHELNPKLVDLFAQRLYDLDFLGLTLHKVVGSERLHIYQPEEPLYQKIAFFSEMETRVYENWKLREIKVWQGSASDLSHWDSVQAVLAGCIPTAVKPPQTTDVVPIFDVY